MMIIVNLRRMMVEKDANNKAHINDGNVKSWMTDDLFHKSLFFIDYFRSGLRLMLFNKFQSSETGSVLILKIPMSSNLLTDLHQHSYFALLELLK
ncbi:hypothetical protein CEXT_721521 [Caerostris extrusa]|uniref:Uncharacterized protein n=1 Tax=Caerostris extrusa TaxID=172846 RepID=A0AAV4QDL6_CAEEX|nr:hypothetical protein CEXT_721521 [Caerostris extrusa]